MILLLKIPKKYIYIQDSGHPTSSSPLPSKSLLPSLILKFHQSFTKSTIHTFFDPSAGKEERFFIAVSFLRWILSQSNKVDPAIPQIVENHLVVEQNLRNSLLHFHRRPLSGPPFLLLPYRTFGVGVGGGTAGGNLGSAGAALADV